MQASAKLSAPMLPPEGIVALALALPAQRQGEKSLPLLALLPFLALGWRAAAVYGTARGWGAASALPWLGIRPLPWSEAGEASESPAGTHSRSGPEALGRPPDEASLSGKARHRGEDAAVLAAFAPMLQFAAARQRQPQGRTSPEPQQALAKTSPFLANPSVRPAVMSLQGKAAAISPEGDELPSLQAADEILSAAPTPYQKGIAATVPQEITVRTKTTDAAIGASSAQVSGTSPAAIIHQRAEAGREPVTVYRPTQRGSLIDLVWQMGRPAAALEVPTQAGVSGGVIDARSPDGPGASVIGAIVRQRAEAGREPATTPELPWRGWPVDPMLSSRETPSIQPGAPAVAAPVLGQRATSSEVGESKIAIPLPWRRQQLRAEVAGLVGSAELVTVSGAIEQWVERHVERVLTRRTAQVQAQASRPPQVPSRSVAEEILDDNVARALMRKLQSLAEEERSRQGYLR